MKKKSAPLASPTEGEDRVVLKPLFGTEPRIYLAILYSLVLLAALFFVFLFPGLSKPGSRVTFVSFPEGASIQVDGKRLGFTPYTGHIDAGRRKILVKKPNFETSETVLEVKNRLLGSLLFPKKQLVEIRMKIKDPSRLFAEAHREYGSWSLTGEPSAGYPFPPVLSEAVRDFYLGSTEKSRDKTLVRSFLSASAKSTDSEGTFKDFLSASLLAGSRGRALTPRGLAESGSFFAHLFNDSEHILLWCAEVFPQKAASELMKLPQAAKYFDAAGSKEKSTPPVSPGSPRELLRLAGTDFIRIPSGTFFQGWAGTAGEKALSGALAPIHRVEVKDFYLAAAETTEADFAEFIKAVPRWKPENRAQLMKEGIAEEGYLASWKSSSVPPSPNLPVREVSYYAAEAYCEWLSTRQPDFSFLLPSEKQWEWAASLDGEAKNVKTTSLKEPSPVSEGGLGKLGLRHMEGNVWEWCADWYFPAAYIFPEEAAFPGTEKCVRGGSWMNPPGSVTVSSRAAQPPSWCTPYLGFRVAAVKK